MTTSELSSLAAALFVFFGALLTLAAAIGLVRFGDTLTRMHPASKPQTLGLILVMTGGIIHAWGSPDVFLLALVALFAVFTAPVVGQRVANVAYRESLAAEGRDASYGSYASAPKEPEPPEGAETLEGTEAPDTTASPDDTGAPDGDARP